MRDAARLLADPRLALQEMATRVSAELAVESGAALFDQPDDPVGFIGREWTRSDPAAQRHREAEQACRNDLMQELVAGSHLQACGRIDTPDGQWEAIPPTFWSDSSVYDWESGHVGGASRYWDVRVGRPGGIDGWTALRAFGDPVDKRQIEHLFIADLDEEFEATRDRIFASVSERMYSDFLALLTNNRIRAVGIEASKWKGAKLLSRASLVLFPGEQYARSFLIIPPLATYREWRAGVSQETSNISAQEPANVKTKKKVQNKGGRSTLPIATEFYDEYWAYLEKNPDKSQEAGARSYA